jgi:hypothetical protein
LDAISNNKPIGLLRKDFDKDMSAEKGVEVLNSELEYMTQLKDKLIKNLNETRK